MLFIKIIACLKTHQTVTRELCGDVALHRELVDHKLWDNFIGFPIELLEINKFSEKLKELSNEFE